MMRAVAIIGIVAAVLAGGAIAQAKPGTPTQQVITVAPEGSVTRGTCRVGVDYTCTVMLVQDEHFKSVLTAQGCSKDAQVQCSWRYDAPAPDAANAAVVVVPNFNNLHANMMIFTDKRTYDINLVSAPDVHDAILLFRDRPAAVVATAGAQCKPSVPNDVLVGLLANAQDPQPFYTAWDPDYRIIGTADFRPLFAYTDGKRTVLAMPSFVQVYPSVEEPIGNQVLAVTPAVKGRMWILDGVPPEIDLVFGKQRVVVRRGR